MLECEYNVYIDEITNRPIIVFSYKNKTNNFKYDFHLKFVLGGTKVLYLFSGFLWMSFMTLRSQ